MIEKGIIREEERDLYIYGLELLLSKIGAGIIAFGMALILRKTIFLLAVLLFFIPIRRYAGGVHAKTRWACFLISEGILILAMVLNLLFVLTMPSLLGMVAFGSVMIIMKSPYDSAKRRISTKQKKKYRMVSIALCVGYWVLFFVLKAMGMKQLHDAMSFSMLIEGSLLIIPQNKKIVSI